MSMSTSWNHPFHLITASPWPLTGAVGALVTVGGMVKWFHQFSASMLLTGGLILVATMIQWWRDVVREGTLQGCHTLKVVNGLRWGMVLFIVSEVFFFISFFWAFFHSSLSPTIDLGSLWPPVGVEPFNPLQIPLLNTAILLASGVTVTWAHHGLMGNNYTQAFQGLFITVVLGVYFTALQAYEYLEASFTIADSVYGSTFFVATGFHGIHVIIGSTFLLVCLARLAERHFSSFHHFGFEAAAWYWHFVDVVWLFLYLSIYWWGG
uniref:cytochrome c oxidase subunit III n=1 Tax=Apachyus feae TaxID=2914707 RepID=UPI001EF9CC9D|nr:cytochrome c oxidase subunit III [Apachyus feae]UKE80566.1 cytochrome c oxidase subunit III [Apachyus feae]